MSTKPAYYFIWLNYYALSFFVVSTSVFNYLTLLNGSRAGTSFNLREDAENKVGRGLDCDIVLSDPLSSRVHALVERRPEGWFLRDAGSRNGTFVNGQKVDEAQLIDGCRIRAGTTEFTFHQSESQPVDVWSRDPAVTQTIVRDIPVSSGALPDNIFSGREDREQRGQDLLLLHQLSLQLLGMDDPDEVVHCSLAMLHDRTDASVTGFLWLSDEGELKPKQVVPDDAVGSVHLSKSLTELVCSKGRAVWVDNQSISHKTSTLDHYADAICVPLLHEQATLGAIHLYLERGHFTQRDFDVSIALANMLVVALVRTRRQAILTTNHNRLVAKSADCDELIGESPAMQRLKKKIARVARATGSVLIRGESGAGKELVARAIHKSSARSDRPMLSVNCAALPRDLMESQLFGHKRGAFTGADSDHLGWFRQAHSGTLFLDEVGEMTLEGQSKLLRILEGHPFLPVGATEEVSVDVRVIAATNRDLREFVRDHRFREELYYRLSVFELVVPPLRDREDDIQRLADFFLDHFKLQHGRPNLTLSKAARASLLSYRWPGNVRQLRNVIDSFVVLADDDVVEVSDLGLHDVGSDLELNSLRIDQWERKLIQEALARVKNNVPEAARLLGISRATLYRKLDEYSIERA